MFLSESHVHLHVEMHGKLEYIFPDLSMHNNKKKLKTDDFFRNSRVISASEDNITTKLSQNISSSDSKAKKLSTSNLSCDTDNDSDLENEFSEHLFSDNLISCDICTLVSQPTICLQFPQASESISPAKDIPIKQSKQKNKKSKHIRERKIRSALNINDYKDCAHKMEEFSADSERKWTLEYFYDKQEDQHKLSKIIIGRGQKDDYPELNTIHLIDAIKGWDTADWRNNVFYALKKNNLFSEKFSLLPTNKTCLFCVNEQQKKINEAIRKRLPLSKPDGVSEKTEEVKKVILPKATLCTEIEKHSTEKDFREERLNILQIGVRKNMIGMIKKLKLASKLLIQNKKKASAIMEEEEVDSEEFEVL